MLAWDPWKAKPPPGVRPFAHCPGRGVDAAAPRPARRSCPQRCRPCYSPAMKCLLLLPLIAVKWLFITAVVVLVFMVLF